MVAALAIVSKGGALPPPSAPPGADCSPLEGIADVPGLPHVLLIGDSISIGYTCQVRARLRGRANVHRPPESCGDTSYGRARLDSWIAGRRWDLIHFNFGLHDLKYVGGHRTTEPAQYEVNLRAIAERLRQTGAVLVFATTTPIPAASQARVGGDEILYNERATDVARDFGVRVNDLHAFAAALGPGTQRPNDVHFTNEGNGRLAEAVAASIEAALAGPRQPKGR